MSTQLVRVPSTLNRLTFAEVADLVHHQAAYMLLSLGDRPEGVELSEFRARVLAAGAIDDQRFDTYLGQLLANGWVRLETVE